MKLSAAGREHVEDLNRQLMTGRFKRIGYASVQLAGHPLTEVDGLPGQRLLRASAYAGYWPGGFPDGDDFAMVVSDSPLEYVQSDMASMLCDQLKKVTVGKRSLQKYEALLKQRPDILRVRENLGLSLVPNIIKACEEQESPLAYVSIGNWTITSAAHGQLYGAIMHFPVGMQPDTALANLKAHAQTPGR